MDSTEVQAALLEMKEDVELIHRLMSDELKIAYLGGDQYKSDKDGYLGNQAAIEEELERLLNLTNNVRGAKKTKYWLQTMTKAFNEIRDREEKAIRQLVAFDGSLDENAEMDKLLVVMTGEVNPVTRAVLKHFLWQIKRKMFGRNVSYHMMPIIWGKQKSGKSETIKKLLGPIINYVYSGLAFNQVNDDRYYRSYSLNFVLFFDEMPKVGKVDIDGLKQLITAPTLTYRHLGKNTYATVPQRATLIGVSNLNPSSLITDSTGMRRFYYIKTVDQMDFEKLAEVNFMKIWHAIDEGRETPYIMEVFEQLDRKQDDWRQKGVIEMFIDEGMLIKSDTNTAPAQDVFNSFCDYVKSQGFTHNYTKPNFEKILEQQYGFEFESLKRSSTSSIKVIKGVLNGRKNQLLSLKIGAEVN